MSYFCFIPVFKAFIFRCSCVSNCIRPLLLSHFLKNCPHTAKKGSFRETSEQNGNDWELQSVKDLNYKHLSLVATIC